jgi:hypothetical protein
MSGQEPPQPHHVALPDRSYRVTKSLYATSYIGLLKWVDNVVPDLGWITQQSSWIGYVVVCDDKREINQMGRRDIHNFSGLGWSIHPMWWIGHPKLFFN